MPLGTNTPSTQSSGKKTPAKADGKAQDAIKLLMADHKEVDALFKKFEKAKDDEDAGKDAIVKKICDELSVHAQIEEEIFYPATREVLEDEDEEMVDEAEVEHAGIKSLVAQLKEMDSDDELYDAKVKVLSEYVKHHVKEEETEYFPEVKKTDLDLEALGAQLAARKEELKSEQ